MENENQVLDPVAPETVEETAQEVAEDKDAIKVPEVEEIVLSPLAEAIVEEREAQAQLRKRDCNMLAILKAHLAENIRLNGILDNINRNIARLKALLNTPKPKMKVGLLLLGLVIILGGAVVYLLKIVDESIFGAAAGVGFVLVLSAIITKLIGNSKWKKFIAGVNAELEVEREKARIAQEKIDKHWAEAVVPYAESITPDKFPSADVYNYHAVCTMLDLMSNLRADSIKEAAVLYDEVCFRSRMDSAFNSMERSLQETARQAARSAAAAERSASANESAAASAAVMAASSVSMAASAEKAARASVKASNASIEASNAVKSAADRTYY